MTFDTLLILVIGAVAFYMLSRRVAFLEQRLRDVESRLALSRSAEASPEAERDMEAEPVGAAAPSAPMPARTRSPWVAPPSPRPAPEAAPEAESETVRVAEPAASGSSGLETLIGGRLPIWIGGAALVLAGFFLVRYSIESGLLGPAARTLLAALFGLALVGASEAARRLPALRDDPRIGQALAGAGIASLYGTLYMAAALYHLVAPLPAFALVLAVTIGALALSLRQGPPTAVMALVGGFAAPLLAGIDAAGLAPLLVYLALFVAALFGLAIRRGWAWLAIAASITGFAWINLLIVQLGGRAGDLSALGGFTMLLAAAASAALPASGARTPLLRLAPLIAGLVQLVVLAPALDFGALAWSFYLVLAAAALFLAWRDPLYLPGALGALALLLVLESLALLQPEQAATPLAAIAATLLFALPGHALVRRSRGWALIAAIGTAGPLLVAQALTTMLLPNSGWAMLDLLAAAGCAVVAWRRKTEADDTPLLVATGLTALTGTIGIALLLPSGWIALPLALATLGLAGWARHTGSPRLFALPALPFVVALVAAAAPVAALMDLVFASSAGDRLPYVRLPELSGLYRALLLPSAALLVTLIDPRQLGHARRLVGAVAIAVALLLVYAAAKQPLAIGTVERFVAWGFVERALLTQACLVAGWALLRAGRWPSLGGVLLTLGLVRLAWFDMLVLDPALVPQQVGGVPILNAAVLHFALAAAWLWTLAPSRPIRIGAALVTMAAGGMAVRQATHGSLMTGPISTLENGGYSAVLLAIALFWLWRGISGGARDLRIAGLGLLTIVTFKVFLIDAAALDGILRILSFLGLGLALIGIGWAYGRFLGRGATAKSAETTD